MNQNENTKALAILADRFGHDTLLSLATLDGAIPAVRIVDSYYENGSFYTITHALSNKMMQIERNPTVAVCGEWFTGHGIATNMGALLDPRNQRIASLLKEAFAAWYHNGHIREEDKNTVILQIRLTDAVLYDHEKRYDIDFSAI